MAVCLKAELGLGTCGLGSKPTTSASGHMALASGRMAFPQDLQPWPWDLQPWDLRPWDLCPWPQDLCPWPRDLRPQPRDLRPCLGTYGLGLDSPGLALRLQC